MYRHEANFQVDGLTTGYRTRELVDSSAKRFGGPLREATRQYDTLINQIDCFQRLTERVTALQDFINSTSSASVLAPPTVRTGNPEISGAAEAGAVLGDYSLAVLQLAQSTRFYSDSWQVSQDPTSREWAPTQPLASGTLTVTLASGATATQPLGNGVAQADVADGITGMGLSISAQIIDDFAHHPPRQTMMFSGLQLGADLGFHLSTSYVSPPAPGSLALNFSSYQAQSANDSVVQIDGRPDTVTSATREVSGALPGINLTLGDGVVVTSPPTPTFLSIEMDTLHLRTQVGVFIDTYNALMAEFVRVRRPAAGTEATRNPVEARERRDARKKALSGPFAAQQKKGDERESDAVALLKGLLGQEDEKQMPGIENLQRDPWVRLLHEQLMLAPGNRVSGIAEYATLGDVGVGPKKSVHGVIDASGALAVDDSVFEPAASAAPLACSLLFAGDLVRQVKGVFSFIDAILVPPSVSDPSTPGAIMSPMTVANQLRQSVNQYQQLAFVTRDTMRVEYERLEDYKAREAKRYVNLEKQKGGMQVKSDYLAQVVESMRQKN